MAVRVALLVTLAGAILAAPIVSCVGSDPPPVLDAGAGSPGSATDGGVGTDTGAAGPSCSCVESPADGWSPPGYLVREASCAAPVAVEAFKMYSDVSGAPATCGQCTCNAQPTSMSCSAPRITLYTSGTCPNGVPSGGSIDLTAAGCYANPKTGITSYDAQSGTVDGSCSAVSDKIPDIPPLQKKEVRLCVPPPEPGAGRCAPGTACQPDPPAGAPAPTLCIGHPGEVDCPSGYPARQRFDGTYDDTRGCTPCRCVFKGAGCTYTFKAYDAASCGGTLLSSGTSGDTCLSGAPKSFRVTAAAVTTATCNSPYGGDPTGGVAVSNPITLCCKP